MANQSVRTPRFYLDFTQLAKAKGYVEDDTDRAYNVLDENGNLDQNNEKNINVWDYDYTYHTGQWPYHQLYKKNVGFELDQIYESKAYDLMEEVIDEQYSDLKCVCFWVIGNSNNIR